MTDLHCHARGKNWTNGAYTFVRMILTTHYVLRLYSTSEKNFQTIFLNNQSVRCKLKHKM